MTTIGSLTPATTSRDYARIERAIRYLDANYQEQPNLDDVAAQIGLSPYHCQRLFSRWAGTSPKRFIGFLTVEHAKSLLASSSSVLDTAYEVGLSGPGRLHDLFVGYEAMTPGEYKQKGAELDLRYGVHSTPFGDCFIVVSQRGITRLTFLTDEDGADESLRQAREAWPLGAMTHDQAHTASWVQRCFSPDQSDPLPLLIRGTNFQIRVWQALLQIPAGRIVTYGDVARAVGSPAAMRAVGRACGLNRIGWLVPCHRVIRQSGTLAGYRWGLERKRAMLAWEAAQGEAA